MLCGVHTLQDPSAQVKLSDSNSQPRRGETKPEQVGSVKQLLYTVTKVISQGQSNGLVELKQASRLASGGGAQLVFINSWFMPRSHQTFRPVPVAKMLGIMFRNRCWPITCHTNRAGDANGWCDQPIME
jgi:hypothetical protein